MCVMVISQKHKLKDCGTYTAASLINMYVADDIELTQVHDIHL